jgi:hypothetical protein
MTSMDRLNLLADLKPNWDSYGAAPPDAKCLAMAREVLTALTHVHLHWDAIPACNGGIQLEHHSGGLDIEVMIERSSFSAAEKPK